MLKGFTIGTLALALLVGVAAQTTMKDDLARAEMWPDQVATLDELAPVATLDAASPTRLEVQLPRVGAVCGFQLDQDGGPEVLALQLEHGAAQLAHLAAFTRERSLLNTGEPRTRSRIQSSSEGVNYAEPNPAEPAKWRRLPMTQRIETATWNPTRPRTVEPPTASLSAI